METSRIFAENFGIPSTRIINTRYGTTIINTEPKILNRA